MLARLGMGMGALASMDLLCGAQEAPTRGPLAPKRPHRAARARRVLHIFANGGPSQVDTFDPKPALERHAGQPLPTGDARAPSKSGGAFPSAFAFKKCGQSGIEVSEIFPNVGQCIDEICVVRSMTTDNPGHEPSLRLMNCGDFRFARPSVGSWITYGLGSENQNLPGFVVLCPGGYPILETENWQSAFLPGAYQGTFIDSRHTKIDRLIGDIRNPALSIQDQRQQLDVARELNRRYAEARGDEPLLEARLQSFELAFRLQMEATDAFDLGREPEAIRRMYGASVQGRQFLIARRLLERGVRFVQVWAGAGQPWDHHENIADALRREAGQVDPVIGALLRDLKQRGMLDDTLVIWGGEFGRTPAAQLPQATGRDHNPWGFSLWLAGGGIKGGTVHGATDEFGVSAVEKPVHIHDLHATILHLLGLDHTALTYRHAGRDFRLTDVSGRIVGEILA
jgi:hypothetical protein